MHILNQIEPEKRRLAQIGDKASMKLLRLQEDVSQSIELDKVLTFSTFITLSTIDFLKILKAKTSDKKAKAELFDEFLSSVYQEEWFKYTPASNDESCYFYLDEFPFSTDYIEELWLKAPESRSPAADNVPPFFKKKNRCKYCRPLCLYFVYPNSYLSYLAGFLENCMYNATA